MCGQLLKGRFWYELLLCHAQVNEKHGQIIRHDQFYMPELHRTVDIKKDYLNWVRQGQGISTSASTGMVSFCDYPFVFDAEAKTQLLQMDALIQMEVRERGMGIREMDGGWDQGEEWGMGIRKRDGEGKGERMIR